MSKHCSNSWRLDVLGGERLRRKVLLVIVLGEVPIRADSVRTTSSGMYSRQAVSF